MSTPIKNPYLSDELWLDAIRYKPEPEPEVTELDFTNTYMSTVHKPRKLKNLAKQHLAELDFDTLVGTGLSGTIATADVARYLKKNYLIVRKANDGSHSSMPVEGKLGKKWIFLDDLVSSGRTFCRVWDTVHKISADRNFKSEYAGMFLYNDESFIDPHEYNSTHRWLTRNSEYYMGELWNETQDSAYKRRYGW
jgi:hypothetical protein